VSRRIKASVRHNLTKHVDNIINSHKPFSHVCCKHIFIKKKNCFSFIKIFFHIHVYFLTWENSQKCLLYFGIFWKCIFWEMYILRNFLKSKIDISKSKNPIFFASKIILKHDFFLFCESLFFLTTQWNNHLHKRCKNHFCYIYHKNWFFYICWKATFLKKKIARKNWKKKF